MARIIRSILVVLTLVNVLTGCASLVITSATFIDASMTPEGEYTVSAKWPSDVKVPEHPVNIFLNNFDRQKYLFNSCKLVTTSPTNTERVYDCGFFKASMVLVTASDPYLRIKMSNRSGKKSWVRDFVVNALMEAGFTEIDDL